MCIADESDRGGELRVFERGVGKIAVLRGFGPIDIPAEYLEGEFGETAHQRGAAGEINAGANRFDSTFRKAFSNKQQCFLQSLADDFVKDRAFDFDIREAVFIGEFGNAHGKRRIAGRIAFQNFQFFRFGKGQAGYEMDVVSDMIAANRNTAGRCDGAIEIERVIGSSSADVDEECAAQALLAVESHLRGGDGSEDNVVDFQRAFADEFDGVLDAVADAVDDVEINFHGFGEKPDGRRGLFQAIHEVFADDGVEGGVIRG